MTQPLLAEQRVALGSILREKAFWGLAALWLLFCFRPLFLDETFFFRDVSYFFFPLETLFGEIVRSGEFPFWDVYRHGGHPYLADLNNSPLYPTNLLFLVLPAVKASTLALVLHYMLCSLSSYLFSRVLGLQQAASFLTGVVYGFCGYILSMSDQRTRLAGMALLPLLLLFWHLYLAERKRRHFAYAVFIGVLQVILGAPEVNVLMMLTLLVWAFGFPFPSMSPLRKILLWGLLAAAIIGLSSFQLLPTIEAVSQSARGEGLDYRVFAQWSLFPKRLPEMFFPAFRGYLDRLPFNIYFWGGNLGDRGYPYIVNIYFGFVTFGLAFLGTCYPGKIPCPRRIRMALAALFLVSLVLAMGRFMPFFPFLYSHVPLISIFRYPIKFLLGGIFPIAFLAGCGAQALFMPVLSANAEGRKLRRNILIALWGGFLLLGALTLLLHVSEDFSTRFQLFFFTRPGTDVSRAGLRHSAFHSSAVYLLFILWMNYRFLQPRSWQRWALVAIVVVDLFSAGRRVSPLAPASYFTSEPALAGRIRREIGDGRLYRSPDPLPQMFYFPVGEEFDLPPEHIMWLYRWQLETLRIYLASNYHIPVIFHRDYNMMAQRRIIRIKELLEALPWERRLPLLSAGGVTLVLSSEELEIPGLKRIEEVPNWSVQPLFLYKNTRAAPRVGLVTNWKEVQSDPEAEEWMLKADFDPRRHVVLQQNQESVFFRIANLGLEYEETVIAERAQCEEPLNVRILPGEIKNNSASYTVKSNCGGFLVFSEQLYPGWRISIDGKTADVKRANLAFSAVWLEAGTHDVRRYYVPMVFFLGMLCSALCSGALFFVMRKGWI